MLCTFVLQEAVISKSCCSALSFSVYRTNIRTNVRIYYSFADKLSETD